MKSTLKKYCIGIVLLFAFASSVQAQTYTWVGGVDTSWTTAGNWTGASVPATRTAEPGTALIIFDGSTMPLSNLPNLIASTDTSATPIPMQFNSGGTFTYTGTGSYNNRSLTAYGNQTMWTVGDGVGGAGDVTVNSDILEYSRHPTQNGVDGINSFVVNSDGVLNSGNMWGYNSTDRRMYVTVNGGELNVSGNFDDRQAASTLTIQNGGNVTISGNLDMGNSISDIVFTDGTISAGRMLFDDPGNAALTVGSTSTLNLGDFGTHVFTDGLTVDGTMGTGNNSATIATIATGALTLNSGATIDYSINGETQISDTWNIGGDLTLGAGTLNLVVDVVAGDVKQSAGPWTIFDWNGTGSGPSVGEFGGVTDWNITAADGTRLATQGSVLYLGDASNGSIVLSGFEAFSIPEPSTAMLLGMGAVVMILRRRMRR